jgi:hypothetical protein
MVSRREYLYSYQKPPIKGGETVRLIYKERPDWFRESRKNLLLVVKRIISLCSGGGKPTLLIRRKAAVQVTYLYVYQEFQLLLIMPQS